ncbi:hypothetical protein Taro_033811 [Colocasia esculenta]|uniref:DUF7648 domain-containing protein n=1 Tax=Colocasia esculenta TaxID=4460 RepID=A0A843VUT9_COLES|nr:hypothetical protein [Colocasia esculenta]
MKGRSNRLPVSSAPSEDWGDGSWTVDCPCGVTFDDGEEMVDCDVCGVWVHTRCSRFVKGEASFACDKCKGRNPRLFSSSPGGGAEHNGNRCNSNGSGSGGTNTEETEVAQLLVELPTKTDPCPPLASQLPPAVRLWTRAPIEERVHVQGVPGGDPSLFQGLSTVFTSELWKCTGYVPKQFNFKYKEFPCWDDEEESENPANRGADLLFSLSKEITPRGQVESYGQRSSPKTVSRGEGKGSGGGNDVGGRFHTSVKKERNKLRVIGVQPGKRKEEHAGVKDQSSKKKARTSGEKAVSENRMRGSSPLGKTFKSNTCEDSASHLPKLGSEHMSNEDTKNNISMEARFSDQRGATESDLKPKHVLVIKAPSGAPSTEPSQSSFPVEAKAATSEEQDGSRAQPKVDVSSVSRAKTSYPVKEEDFNAFVDVLRHTNKESDDPRDLNEDSSSISVKSDKSKSGLGDVRCTSSDMTNVPIMQNSNTMIPPATVKVKIEAEPVAQDGQGSGGSVLPPPPITNKMLHGTEHTTEHQGRPVGQPPEGLQNNDTAKIPISCKDKSLDAETEPKIKHLNQETFSDRTASRSGELKLNEQEIESPALRTGEEGSSESIHNLKYEETAKSRTVGSNSLASTEVKFDPCVEKYSSSSSTPVFPKLSLLGLHKSPGSAASSTAEKVVTKQRVKMNMHAVGKENSTISTTGEERVREITRQTTKSHPTGSTSSGSKSSQTFKTSYSNSRHSITDSKEHLHCPSSKITSRSEKTVKLSSFGETTASQYGHSAPTLMKPTATSSCQKNENAKHQACLTSSKVNHSMTTPPPSINASAQLSDEELALLLHQELNSSPRVPRVPRIRQAGGYQLTSGAATSILSRRSSSTGGKDHTLVSRRKNKEDVSKDGSRCDEIKRVDRYPSPEIKKEDANISTDASAKKDGHSKSCDSLSSSKKSIQPCSTTSANNGSSSSVEADGDNALSMRNSPKNVFGDDATTLVLTLPGLIDEIMSKGKCSTYEELCSEHWRNLRKPNGERYAYSNHSQAVLDCLRNRSEWAHLIDRGPKTNSSRKKRKFAVDTLVESENEEGSMTPGEAEDKDRESHLEDVPKGKRKARKRRLLALQGRTLRAGKRQKQDALSDDEARSSSPSSVDGAQSSFSDEESQGTGPYAAGGEYTSSSDDSD